MHINDLYEQQAKDLLHKLCDALGIEQEDRTKAKVEAAIASKNKKRFCVYTGIRFSGGGWIKMSKDIDCPIAPFVGMSIWTDGLGPLAIRSISYYEETGDIECEAEWTKSSSSEDDGLDMVRSIISKGWKYCESSDEFLELSH